MKAVLLSIKAKYCELIANGKKTIEVRKTMPKIGTPFKCYIYCTKQGRPLVYGSPCPSYIEESYIQTYGYSKAEADKIFGNLQGKVIGEFVCDAIYTFEYEDGGFLVNGDISTTQNVQAMSCLSDYEFRRYANEKTVYGWHISDLVIYDEPKELDEFSKPCSRDCKNCKYWYSGSVVHEEPPYCEWEDYAITRPPQSWCYGEELEGVKNEVR